MSDNGGKRKSSPEEDTPHNKTTKPTVVFVLVESRRRGQRFYAPACLMLLITGSLKALGFVVWELFSFLFLNLILVGFSLYLCYLLPTWRCEAPSGFDAHSQLQRIVCLFCMVWRRVLNRITTNSLPAYMNGCRACLGLTSFIELQ